MATFRVQVFYEKGSEAKWTNVYHVAADTLLEARDNFSAVAVAFLLDLLNTTCSIAKILVSDPLTDDFSEEQLNQSGTSSSGGTLLPLFNSVKVLVQPANLGRADYKFLKGYLTEDLHSAGQLGTGVAATVDGIFTSMIADMIAATAPLCSENGDLWVSASVQNAVQMRQMHRRRRRS
jgi:hypothetical protein